MKIVVSELPYWDDDCLFFKGGVCSFSELDCVLTGRGKDTIECPFLLKLDIQELNNID